MNIEIVKINESTWRIENSFVYMYLLTGSERALLIDSGASCPNVRQIAESLTDLPVTLLNTHGDGDHLSGNGAFPSFYMHPDDYKNCNIAEKFPGSTLMPLSDGDVIDLGGRPVEVIAIPGHTYGSVALLDVNSRTLYSGDSVQSGHIFMFGAHRKPEAFAEALRKLEAMTGRFDQIYASHGESILPADYIKKVSEAWQQMLSGNLEAHEESLHGTTVLAYDAPDCGFYCSKT